MLISTENASQKIRREVLTVRETAGVNTMLLIGSGRGRDPLIAPFNRIRS